MASETTPNPPHQPEPVQPPSQLPDDAHADTIIEALEAEGIVGEHLDGIIHDLKSEEAAEINNDGLASQVRYMLSARITPENILNYGRDGKEEWEQDREDG